MQYPQGESSYWLRPDDPKGDQPFNPRLDRWEDHFSIDEETGAILGATDIGRATVDRLEMNRETQLTARLYWTRLGLFP